MNLCSDGHDEVCYETKKCPCCEWVGEVEDLRAELETLAQGNHD